MKEIANTFSIRKTKNVKKSKDRLISNKSHGDNSFLPSTNGGQEPSPLSGGKTKPGPQGLDSLCVPGMTQTPFFWLRGWK